MVELTLIFSSSSFSCFFFFSSACGALAAVKERFAIKGAPLTSFFFCSFSHFSLSLRSSSSFSFYEILAVDGNGYGCCYDQANLFFLSLAEVSKGKENMG